MAAERRVRPEPRRSCVACREGAGKRSLIRVARAPDGTVGVDATGRAPGRGAYVHPDPACIARAARGGALARGLRASLDRAEAARLMNELMELVGATT